MESERSDQTYPTIVDQMLEQGVTAVFCVNDGVALALLEVLEQRGVRVPDEMSVIGFDDVDQHSSGGLRPSSIGFDDQFVARSAVETMEQLIASSGQVEHINITASTHVMEHDTTGPGPGGVSEA